MKRTFTVIRGGKYNDMKGLEEQKTARTKYADQKAFFAACKKASGEQPTWDSEVLLNRNLSRGVA